LPYLRLTDPSEGGDKRLYARAPYGTSVAAASFQTAESFEAEGALEFVQRISQYLSGCRMLQSCYIFGEFHHILVRTAPLARVLHCVVESVACPIRIVQLLIRDPMGGTAGMKPEQRVRQHG
jgi:hypothetical protein